MEIELLRTVSLLRKLTEEELRAFAAQLSVHEFQPKERIVEEGKPVKNLYLVCDGVVFIRRLSGDTDMLLGRLGPGGFFGEINLFNPSVATASIYAMRPSRIAYIDDTKFHAFMDEHPIIGYKITSAMMVEMGRRLSQTSERLVHSSYWSHAAGAVPGDAEDNV